MQFELNKFQDKGYSGPYNLFDNKDCEKILNEKYFSSKSLTWYKSIHEKSSKIIDFASQEKILEKIKTVLGNNVLLWGSHFIDQKPHKQHMWHLDVEFGPWNGLTVWIGLKNLNEKPPCILISGQDSFKKNKILLKQDVQQNNTIMNKFKTKFIYKVKNKLTSFYKKFVNK